MLNLLISCCLYFGFPTSLSLYEMSSDKKMMALTYSSQKESTISQQKELLKLSSEDMICMYSCQLTKRKCFYRGDE
uniref:Putative ovule protein n=1 Tax=Solanum chacoense TaxID=4108 RepID=A0A0V0I436_SOLCH